MHAQSKTKRKGTILSLTLVVMLVLGTLSGAVFGLAYINRRSAQQQIETFKARAAARSLLFSIGSAVVVSNDIVAAFTQGTHTGGFKEGSVSADIRLERTGNKITIFCDVWYAERRSGEMRYVWNEGKWSWR